ncbi:MAG: large conductance mechanosensitive channel protein MscL [Tepidiformaceae bacterium]
MLNDFKAFLLRGSVVDLAVAVVIGVALGALVTAFVEDFITPLLAALFGEPDFSQLDFTINDSTFRYGHFLNALLSFLVIAAAVFFFVVVPVNALIERSRREPTPDPTTRHCPECQSEIPTAARRCAFCTSEIAPAARRKPSLLWWALPPAPCDERGRAPAPGGLHAHFR